jgi:hypothetical protein
VGLEAACTVRFKRKVAAGAAHLEADRLIFRGPGLRLQIPFKAVSRVAARGGKLLLKFPEGVATFALGSQASRWALKVRYPRGLLDKLGVKPDARVSVLGVRDASFLKELRARATDISEGRTKKDSDLVFFGADKITSLTRLEALKKSIKRNGALWVVWPKGVKALTEDDVRARGKEVGLVDVKVVSFSETLSALKMVIPLALR